MMKEDQLLFMDRYEILGTLRRGPAASVSLAYDRHLGRRVVLKAMPLPSNGFTVMRELARRLVAEVRTAGALNHPNIVTVYDVADDDEGLCISMELLEGNNLAQRLRTEGRLPVLAALGVVDQVACALAFAHAHGVVHGSLRPSNVLTLADGRIRVADFGLTGRAFQARGLWSPRYMAPEQVRGRPTTEATDVWGIGVLLYEMLTGRPPFEGESADACSRILTDTPTPPRTFNPDVPPALENVILTCLEKEPTHRFPSIATFLGFLEKARPLPPPPPETLPVTMVEAPAGNARRGALAIVLLMLLALAWLAWRVVSATHGRTAAGFAQAMWGRWDVSLPAARAPAG